MNPVYIILSVLYALGCLALITVILMQKKRSAGLGSMTGMGNSGGTYWDRNKGRSLEGTLEKYTKIGGFIFFVFTVAMCVVK